MNIGDHVTTLATTRPRYYANVSGEIVTRNGEEWGVEIKGRIVWFLEKEITKCQGQATSSTSARGAGKPSFNGGERGTTGASQPTRGQLGARTPSGGPTPSLSPDRPLTNPSSAVPAPPALSEPDAVSGAPGILQPVLGTWQLCPECGFKRDAVTGRHFQKSPTTSDCERLYPLTAEPVLEGSRGPAGGIYARCQRCGEMWERPKQRGRPAARCPRCRHV